MQRQPKDFYEFGPFRLDMVERVLLRETELVPLTPKAFDLLLALVQNSGRVLEKEELMKMVWPDTTVDEGNLTQHIFVLRKTLGEGSNEQKYIETIPRRGYRFVASVTERWGEEQGSKGAGEQGSKGAVVSRRSLVVSEQLLPTTNDQQPTTSSAPPLPGSPAPSLPRSPALWSFRSLVVLVIGLATVIYYLLIWNPSRATESGVEVNSLAVLPFLGIEASDETLRLGMADALITKLSNLRQIIVRPTSAVLKYADPGHNPVTAGREMGVGAVLEGKIQKSGDRIRVTVQLVRVRDGSTLWADTFDERFTNIFALQDSISEKVASALTLTLTGEEQRQLTKHHTENTEAYQLYLKARYYWNKRTTDGLKKSIDYFQHAIELDPNYALAYAGQADAYALLANPQPQPQIVTQARAAAMKALELDDTLAEAHTSLAFVKFNYDWDWAGAEREFKRAIELNPNYATARHWYAYYLITMGRPDQAVASVRRAQELDPLSLIINTDLGDILFYARRTDEAIEQYHKTLELDPNFLPAIFNLGLVYEQKGMYKEAVAQFQKAIALSDRSPDMVAALGHVYAVSGERAKARVILDELTKRSTTEYVLPYDRAVIYVGLGEKDQAVAWLQKDYEERALWPDRIKADPRLDPIRSDVRFTGLLRRLGLLPFE